MTVLVVGDGPSGAACALALQSRGIQAVVARRRRPRRGALPETCTGELVRQLEMLAGTAPPDVFRPLKSIGSAWGTPELDTRSFAFWHAGSASLVDRECLDHWLAKAVLRDTRAVGAVRTATEHDGGWRVELDATRVDASFVVDASGRHGGSHFHADASRRITDSLVALHSEVGAAGSSSSVPDVWIESAPDGWWYGARTAIGSWAIAHYLDADAARGISEAVWRDHLARTQIARTCVGANEDIEVRSRDARTGARRLLWRRRWLCIGDAAWSLDPLSGNGLARAIDDGVRAAEAIASYLDEADATLLRSYALAKGERFRDALLAQRTHYAVERRWADEAFWARRQRSTPPEPTAIPSQR